MQFELSGERQTALSHHPPLALAEVPSTFAELIVFDRLLEQEHDPDTRRALIAQKVEGSFATIFRQTVMVRYEQQAYGLRGEGKALLPDRLADFWIAANRPYYGDVIELPEGYRYGWSYIPHFIHTRFYTYAYVFALLASLSLYGLYRADRSGFAGPYLEFLALGSSVSPADQLRVLGLDIEDPGCWDRGIAELERLVRLAEEA
jgi:oligoendopeptidase F